MAVGRSIKMYLTIFVATTCIYMVLYQYHISGQPLTQSDLIIKHKDKSSDNMQDGTNMEFVGTYATTFNNTNNSSTAPIVSYSLATSSSSSSLSSVRSSSRSSSNNQSNPSSLSSSLTMLGAMPQSTLKLFKKINLFLWSPMSLYPPKASGLLQSASHSSAKRGIISKNSLAKNHLTTSSTSLSSSLLESSSSASSVQPLSSPSSSSSAVFNSTFELIDLNADNGTVSVTRKQLKQAVNKNLSKTAASFATSLTSASSSSSSSLSPLLLTMSSSTSASSSSTSLASELPTTSSIATSSATAASASSLASSTTISAVVANRGRHQHTPAITAVAANSMKTKLFKKLTENHQNLKMTNRILETKTTTTTTTTFKKYKNNNNKSNTDNPSQTSVPPLYIITPTYRRPEQLAELTRLGYTLKHITNLLWLVIEDANKTSSDVVETLNRIGVPYEYFLAPMPEEYKKGKKSKPRGVSNRNRGLEYLRANATEGVFYFADDDNTYDINLFEQMRYTQKVSMWPVGLVTKYGVSSPIVKNGKLIGFYDGWIGGRKYPVDMAGFAVSVRFLNERPNAKMPFKAGYEEDGFLKSLAPLDNSEIELLANNCTEILSWHTQTKKNNPGEALNMTKYGDTSLVLLDKHLVRP